MSRTWPERIAVFIGPAELTLKRPSRRRGHNATANATVLPITDGDYPALGRTLEEAIPTNSVLDVVVSDRFVRYALLPWTPLLKDHTEWHAFARESIVTLYGGQTVDWPLSMAGDRDGSNRVACALQPTLLACVAAAAESRQSRIDTFSPLFVSLFNRDRRRLGSRTWYVVQETNYTTFGLLSDRRWCALFSRRTVGDGLVELETTIDRENLSLRNSEPCHDVALVARTTPRGSMSGRYRFDTIPLAPD